VIRINSKYSNGILLLSYIVFISGCSHMLSGHIEPRLLNTLQHNAINIDLNNPVLESSSYKALGLSLIDIPPTMQALIVTHEKTRPTRYTQKFKVLAQCHLIGLRIELDDQHKTAEWLITPDNHCPNHSPNKIKPFWIVQQDVTGKREVKVAGRTQGLSIWKKSRNNDKNKARVIAMHIEVTKPSRFTGEPLPVICHAFWEEDNAEGYAYQNGFVEVYREDSMLPYKQWMPVHGEDDWVKISSDFVCPVE